MKGTARSAGLIFAVVWMALYAAWAQDSAARTVHVFVALADNQTQGIIPVAAKLGNGEDPERNLYWGSAYGVKTFFTRSPDWERITCGQKPKAEILERCVFKFRAANVYLVADAYRGREIRQAILDFLSAASGDNAEMMSVPALSGALKIATRGGSNLVAYIGHDGLMDFQLQQFPRKKNEGHRDAVVLACASKQFFAASVRASGAYPLLWTTGLMAPEAYTLKSALDGWIVRENNEQVRDRAAGHMTNIRSAGFARRTGCSSAGGDMARLT